MGCCLERDKSTYSDQTTQSQIQVYELLARMIAEQEEKNIRIQQQQAIQKLRIAQQNERMRIFAEQELQRRKQIKGCSGILDSSPQKDQPQPQPKSQILNSNSPMPRNVLNSHKYLHIIRNSQLKIKDIPQECSEEQQQVKSQPLSQSQSQSEIYTTISELLEIHLKCFYCRCLINENILALPCQHYFHEQCFTQMVQKQIDDIVLIPVCSCGTKLKSINIRKSVSSDILDKYLQNQYEYLQQITNI